MSVARTEMILDRARNAVVSMDDGGRVVYWNPAAETTFGIARGDALGRAVADLIVPARFREAHTGGLRRFLSEGVGPMLDRRIEVTAVRADGTEFPVELTITGVHEDSEWTFTAFVQDISWRQEAERERERLVEELRRALRGTERRFEAVVGSLSDPVTIRDRENRIVYANAAALTHLGYESVEELRATAPERIMAQYVVLAEDGRAVSMDEIPSVRLLRGESPEPLVIRTIDRRTGVEAWSLLKSAPLLDDAGAVEATITVIEDITDHKRAERRAHFVAQASEILASSLDYGQTLGNVAQLAVPDIADWCAVDLVGADGGREPVAVAHIDPARLRMAEELRAYEPARLDSDRGLGRVLRTGQSMLYPEITDEMLVAAAADTRHLELLRAVGFRSAAIVPMRIARQTLGALTLVTAESGRVLDRSDVELAEQVAARAAVAIENARVYSRRSMIAHTLQESLLPAELPTIPGYELASVYLPALEGTEVGGDFYDVWETRGTWMITIGDVTGKGVQAAALTALVRHTLRATAEFTTSPGEMLARLDAVLKKHPGAALCTALCLRLDGDRLVVSSGGHPLPIHLTANGAHEVGASGPLLGAFDGARWHDVALDFAPQTTLVIYTDGITDAVGSDRERYGLARLQTLLSRCHPRSAPEIINLLADELRRFQVGDHADDTAAVVLRRSAGAPGIPRTAADRDTSPSTPLSLLG